VEMQNKWEFSVFIKIIILGLSIVGTFILNDIEYMPILFWGLVFEFIVQRNWKILKIYLPFYIILTIVRWLSRTYMFPIVVFSEFYIFILWWLTPIFMAMHDIMTTSPSKISAFLSKIKAPKSFILGVLVACRFIPTVKSSIKGVNESMHNRELTGIKNIFLHPIRSYEYVLVPILMMSLNSADQLSASAVVRGIEAPFKRGSYYGDKMGLKDLIGAIVIIVTFCYMLYRGRVKCFI